MCTLTAPTARLRQKPSSMSAASKAASIAAHPGTTRCHAQVEANRKKSKVRVRIEHVFGAQENAPGGRIIRTIGAVRARAQIGLQNLVYNVRRLVILERTAIA